MNWKQWFELRDGSEGEEQEPVEDGEQRDGSVAEHAGHSKRDLERVKKALMKLHVYLGHPGVKELSVEARSCIGVGQSRCATNAL